MHMSRQLTLSTVLIAVLASGIVLYQQISPTQASQTAKDPETDAWQMLVTQQIMASEYQFRKKEQKILLKHSTEEVTADST